MSFVGPEEMQGLQNLWLLHHFVLPSVDLKEVANDLSQILTVATFWYICMVGPVAYFDIASLWVSS